MFGDEYGASGQVQFVAQVSDHGLQCLVQAATSMQHPAEQTQGHGFALTADGLGGAVALAGGKLAGDDPHGKQQDQCDPLIGIGNGKGVVGQDMEPVKGEEGGDGGEDGRAATVPYRYHHDDDQVEH